MATDNTKTQRRPLGYSLGTMYGNLRGYNPLAMFNNFGRNFKQGAGIPQNARLWTPQEGITIGNLPTISEYKLNNTANNSGFWQLADGRTVTAGDTLSPEDVQWLRAEAQKQGLPFTDADITASAETPGQGTSLGALSRWGMGLYQGGKALKGIYDNVNADSDLQNLQKDIRAQVASNPMYNMYLDAADEKLLRQSNNGTLTNGVGSAFEGVARGIPKALLSAVVGGATGGVGGAAIGGIGSLINSGIEGYGQGTAEASDKLQGLYDRLRQADQEYRTMKRPTGLRRAGLSTNYYNQLY